MERKIEKAAFGAGCFWGVEEGFSKIGGVVSTAVGYMGGNLKNPTYKNVCAGKTGHAETVQAEYDPRKVSYEKLLEVFWKMHDPTSLNRQGPDIGAQYRSVIFYYTQEQKEIAEKSKSRIQKKFKNKIVTEIRPASAFYRAEEYHQKYYQKNALNKLMTVLFHK